METRSSQSEKLSIYEHENRETATAGMLDISEGISERIWNTFPEDKNLENKWLSRTVKAILFCN